MAPSNPAWQKGIRYLVETQMPDGSWHVASRLHPPAQVSPAYFESGYPYETIRALMEKGHHVTWADGPYGGYQAIEWDGAHHVYVGASEGRKDGQAAGY